MKQSESSHELLLSDTLVPDIFVTQYAQELSKEAICVYLWLLMNCGYNEFSREEIYSYSILSKDDADKATAGLIENGLLLSSSEDKLVLADIKRAEVDSYIKTMVSKEDGMSDPVLSADEESRNMLAGSINKTFYMGKMSYLFYRLVDKCLYEYKFHSSVVYSLFGEGRDLKIHLKVNSMYDLAESWRRNGYTTPDKLKAYYDKKGKREQLIALMGRLTRRRLNDNDLKRIDCWVEEFDTSVRLAEYAFKVNEFRGNITLKNVEDKLREWYAAGVSDIDAAAVYENMRRQENKAKSSRGRSRNNPHKTYGELEQKSAVKKTAPETKTEEKPKSEEKTEQEQENDDILTLFGGVDEDN